MAEAEAGAGDAAAAEGGKAGSWLVFLHTGAWYVAHRRSSDDDGWFVAVLVAVAARITANFWDALTEDLDDDASVGVGMLLTLALFAGAWWVYGALGAVAALLWGVVALSPALARLPPP